MIKTTRLKTSQVPKNITYDLTPQVDGVKQTFELPEKVYDLDQHYVLFNGQVYRNDGNHTFYTISADGMELTTLFDEAPRPGASYVLQFVKTEIAEGDGAASKSYVDGKVADEATARENADIALGQRIDTVIAASDVKDIVGTHADLEAYDTSTLGDNDIIKVLADETQSGKISYYRWNAASSQFSLIGSEGPYQMVLTAGTNISIDSDNVISATDTTYSNFVGTDGVDPGVAGLVPAPAATDAGKFLKADGTWDTAGSSITLYTTYGQNTDGAMTQKATTDLVYTTGDPKKINIGDNGITGGTNSIIIGSEDSGSISSSAAYIIAIGHNITEGKDNSIAIGNGASTGTGSTGYYGNAIAIGHFAEASRVKTIAIGSGLNSSDSARATGENNIAIGSGAYSHGQYAVCIGKGEAKGYGLVIGGEGNYGAPVADGDNDGQAIKIGLSGEAKGRALAIGLGAIAKNGGNTGAVAIGDSTTADGQSTVALGAFSKPRAKGVVDVGISSNSASIYDTAGYNNTRYRLISGVHDGEQLHDAATVAQGNTLATSAPTTATAGVLGQLYTDTAAMHTYQCTAIDTTDPDNPVYTWTQRW